MSTTLIEPTLFEGTARPGEVLPEAPRKRWRSRLKWLAVIVACLWLADTGISLVIQHTPLKRRLTTRLEAALGRSVEVKGYKVSLWSGPALEAYSVTVGEDPRFGQEYFVRAESLTVRLSWRSLLSGHFELGTISLGHPSLNLVRDASGDWNLAEWLPRPAISPSTANSEAGGRPAQPGTTAPRFRRIDIDSGRINFKRGDDKLPFAFVNVNGSLQTEGSGLWRLDVVAVPSRAAVIVQQPGILHLTGRLGGTTSRLRPAALEISWSDGSLVDVSRLLRDRDYGVRGNFGLSVSARTEGDSWLLSGNALFAQLHRWDLALRSDNPSLSAVASGRLDANGSRIELTQAKVESPHSSARVSGVLDWTRPAPDSSATQLRVTSDGLGLSDVLAWAHAFRANVAEGIALDGYARLDLVLGGWPPLFRSGSLDLPRGVARGNPTRPAVRIGPLVAAYDSKKGITLSPTTVTWGAGASANSLRLDGSAKADASSFLLHLVGNTAQARDILGASNRLGWNLARGWDVAGPARCDLRVQRAGPPAHTTVTGTLEWGTQAMGAFFRPQFLNLPIEHVRARVEMKPGSTRVTLASAEAFGTRWNGTFDHELADGWQFVVSGDALSAASLDRWLNPRWRESFFDRVLPFLSTRPAAESGGAGIRARGRLSLNEFALAPVVVRHVSGDLALDGRHLELSNVTGDFYRGRLGGSLQADLDAAPRYTLGFDFAGVDVHALSSQFPSFSQVSGGEASGKILFHLRGANRAELLDSIECRGTGRVSEPAVQGVQGLSLAQSASEDQQSSDPVMPSIRDASSPFVCAAGKIEFQNLLLEGENSAWEGTGSVDFARNLELRFHLVEPASPGPREAGLASGIAEEYRVSGTIESPHVIRVPVPSRAANDKP